MNKIPIRLGDKTFLWGRGDSLTETDMKVIQNASDDKQTRLEYAFLFSIGMDLDNPRSEALGIWVEMSKEDQTRVVQEWSEMHNIEDGLTFE